jgi:magnesium chelatase subunit D
MSAQLATALVAMDPTGFGGMVLRGPASPLRDELTTQLKAYLPSEAPFRRLPSNISDDRLLGGLDLALTLAQGRTVSMRGLLAESDGGIIIAPMAERMSIGLASRLAMVMDLGEVRTEREGLSLNHPARFGVVALDEGLEDELVPLTLTERLAFVVMIEANEDGEAISCTRINTARRLYPRVSVPDEVMQGIAAAALAFGVASVRATQFALRAARGIAALDGRDTVTQADAALAVKLVLIPRATQMPQQEEAPPDNRPQPEPQDAASDGNNNNEDNEHLSPESAGDRIVEATQALLPADLLARLMAANLAQKRKGAGGKSQQAHASKLRGRPIGARPGDPRSGARLALLDTLRTAAPWQKLRAKTAPAHVKLHIRREDFRVKRHAERKRVTTIFVVDASGSAALHRLSEAKGAVQHLLAQCYARRDQAALISFRGTSADILLPPTRSLTRVRRQLARMPGGGGTPLAAGIAMAEETADQAARRGDTPVIVFLTDGQANVTRDGVGERSRAEKDAHASAQRLARYGFASVVIDTSPRPQQRAQRLAQELGARYMPLPAADPARVAQAVQAATR